DRPAGFAVLLRHYADLPAEVRRDLKGASMEALIPALREVLSSGSDGRILGALRAIQDLKRPELAHLTVEWLQAEREAVVLAAARALLSVARQPLPEPADQRRLDRALAPAVRSYESHRSDQVLLAAALQLPHAGPELQGVLNDDEQAALMPLRGLVRRSTDAQLLPRLLSLLASEPVRGAVRQRLTQSQGLEDTEAFLRAAHLAQVPAIRAELRQLDRPLRALPTVQDQARLSAPAQLGYARFSTALRLQERIRAERLADGVAFHNPLARLLALQTLLNRDTEDADRAVVHFCFDPKTSLARLATRYLIRRNPAKLGDSLKALRQLRRSPHEPVRRLMVGTPAGPETDFETAWDLVQKGRPLSALVMARAVLKRDRGAVLESLRRRIVNGSREHRLRAILLAQKLGVLTHAELELLACLTGEDSRIAASAVSALAEVESPASADALTACLDHHDSRVQANAVEAIDRRLPWQGAVDALVRGVEPIKKLLGAEANRPRANALRTLLRAGCAEPKQVAELLRDERPLHRVSGLWLVGKLGLSEVQEEIEAIAREEKLPPVRQRAEVVVRRLKATPRTAVPIAYVSQTGGVD
ncbi:MAG: HEAT repeat domain-containing protein, partial [Phycisphaerales bacterium JB038]